ncbi:predicted protein [Nematostella vectensis]|uniref:Uncharacterized protein n=1 Tax=Nematostella vectensis TaxID=45351 RepID=A7SAL8_NEMVE|nr:uncharacterized protein LOC5510841 [Nematostella vectensis]EDO39242.1 predicted protein [Nematostella vectensis]|eukprot:XP_001631305.1 predicted protein [Nematostella vectensis]
MSETETAVENAEDSVAKEPEVAEEPAKEQEPPSDLPDTALEQPAEASTDKNGETEVVVEPPKKRQKKTKTPQKALIEPIPNDRYPFARSRGIRIFSDREIESQDAEMTREYWTFWNMTAEELCSDRAYNDWGKRDLKLYIDAAWIIHKTYMQEVLERQLAEGLTELNEKHGYAELPQRLKTQDQNVTTCLSKLQDATANLNQLNLELTKVRGKHLNLKQRVTGEGYTREAKEEEVRQSNRQVGELEKNLYEGMSEVKRHQDSMKKALNRMKNLIFKARSDRPVQDASTSTAACI